MRLLRSMASELGVDPIRLGSAEAWEVFQDTFEVTCAIFRDMI